jgi:alpha-mannosidase
MNLRELAVLLPCHSLEDFPVYHEGVAADELLAAWCAPWHPALIAAVGAVPTWHRVDVPPEHLGEKLLCVPPFCLDRLPAGFTSRAEVEGGVLVAESSLAAATAKALEVAGISSAVDPHLADDFHALGFCRLQVDLLTRQMRYQVNIDEVHFAHETVAAARAAVEGNVELAREHLQRGYDTLYEARKHFYPVDVYLLDMTLLAPTTLGPALAAEVQHGGVNLLAASDVLRQCCSEHHEHWLALLDAINHGRVCVLGGDDRESELPLLPIERTLEHLRDGALEYETLIGQPPVVYGRRRAGLSPVLPQLLAKFGYQGALHFTLDDGKFPLGPQVKVRWEGLETSVIDIYARVPSEAAKPETFLALSRLLADSMDSDHVATLGFAHWPGVTSPWYRILRRIAELSPVLGKFILLDEYFMHTDMPGRLSKFEADDYRTPYLKQAIIQRHSNPLSNLSHEHWHAAERSAREAVATVCELLGQSVETGSETQALLSALGARLARGDSPAAPGYLVFNPQLATRQIGVEVSELAELPAVAGPVVAAGVSGQRKFAVVEVPGMGFATFGAAASAPAPVRGAKSIIEGHALRNEFLEVRVSATTGGIQAVYNYAKRGNQLSQQVALRLGSSGGEGQYSTMRAESVEVTANCTVYGEIVSRGTLLDGERPLGKFRQQVSLWAGSRVARIDLELSDLEEPRADPWNSYYAARFAWPDAQSELYRGVSGSRQKTTAARLEAPEFIDIEHGGATTSILTGGLPYSRLTDDRMLDTILVVRGERERTFRFGIGVDLPYPAATAVELLQPQLALFEPAAPARPPSGWFFHLGAKNLICTHWAPIYDARESGGSEPAIKGFRVRLLEVEGRAGRTPLRAFREIAYARQVDFLGETILELYVDGDKIMLDYGPNELVEVEAHWIR